MLHQQLHLGTRLPVTKEVTSWGGGVYARTVWLSRSDYPKHTLVLDTRILTFTTQNFKVIRSNLISRSLGQLFSRSSNHTSRSSSTQGHQVKSITEFQSIIYSQVISTECLKTEPSRPLAFIFPSAQVFLRSIIEKVLEFIRLLITQIMYQDFLL